MVKVNESDSYGDPQIFTQELTMKIIETAKFSNEIF